MVFLLILFGWIWYMQAYTGLGSCYCWWDDIAVYHMIFYWVVISIGFAHHHHPTTHFTPFISFHLSDLIELSNGLAFKLDFPHFHFIYFILYYYRSVNFYFAYENLISQMKYEISFWLTIKNCGDWFGLNHLTKKV